jgi:hypothetical protein
MCVAVLFQFVYITYLSTHWGYMGFLRLPVTAGEVALTYVLALLPALLLPDSSRRRTVIVFFVLYHLFYIPSQFCLLYTGPGWDGGLAAQVALCVGFGLVAASFRLKAYAVRIRPLAPSWFTGVAMAMVCAAIAVIVVVGWSSLRLPGFFEASGSRRAQEAATGLFTLPGVGYLLAWTQYVGAPMLIVAGLIRRRPGLLALGGAGELAIYSATTAKFALLVPLFVIGGWLVARRGTGASVARVVSWGAMGLFSSVLAANLLLGLPNRIEKVLAYFVERYFGYQGLSTVEYARFAESFGYTYWSHVKGIAEFVTYPFDRAVPWAVAMYWRGTADMSAPSHPWAHDGLLAAGLPGVVVISLLIAAVFWATDAAVARLRTEVVVPLLLIQAVLLSESSLFTQLLTNGWMLLCLLGTVAPVPFRVDERSGEPCRRVVGAAAPSAGGSRASAREARP